MPKRKKEVSIQPAKLWKRLAAFIIDLFLINLILLSPFSSLTKELLPETTDIQELFNYVQENPEVAESINLIRIITSGLAILYFAIMERFFAQTVGKMVMHIRVKSLTEKLRFWQCVARSLFFIPFFPFGLFWIIEPVSLLFNKDKRRTLELLSKTTVTEEQVS
tara:strand:- start:394 stop:885 length:492 start_codon:yes stop_codon:yes gene_type:complete